MKRNDAFDHPTRFLALLLLTTALIVPLSASARSSASRAKAKAIKAKYGVRVLYRYRAKLFFPAVKLRPPYSASCTQASHREVAKALSDIKRFLSDYRRTVIRANLKRIYVCGIMKFHGVRYAGTYIGKNLYIDDDDPYFHLHHEFSSVLMRNRSYGFPWAKWKRLRRGIPDLGTEMFLSNRYLAYRQSKELLRKGFFIAYAESNLENDFNVVAEYHLTDPYRLSKQSKHHPKMMEKVEIVRKMYKPLLAAR